MKSRERGSQATDHRDLPGLGFARQPPPIHLPQGVQPSAVGVVELAFAIAGEQVIQRFLVLAGHLHVIQAQDFFVRETVNGHVRCAPGTLLYNWWRQQGDALRKAMSGA
jgi:hypothetical protein